MIDDLGVGPRLAAFGVAAALALAAGAGLGALVPAVHDEPGAPTAPAEGPTSRQTAPDADHEMDGMEHSAAP